MEAAYDDFEYYDEPQTQSIEKSKIKYRAGFFIGGFLITLAFVFDIVEAILALFTAGVGSYVKDFAEIIVFPILFWIFKIPFWKGNKRVAKITASIVTVLVSLIPFVSDILPELTIGVLVTILYSRVEDRLGLDGKLLGGNPNSKITRFKRERQKIRK
jgi:predicted branched-subunit amino acid permease